jgi:hypothetical protein
MSNFSCSKSNLIKKGRASCLLFEYDFFNRAKSYSPIVLGKNWIHICRFIYIFFIFDRRLGSDQHNYGQTVSWEVIIKRSFLLFLKYSGRLNDIIKFSESFLVDASLSGDVLKTRVDSWHAGICKSTMSLLSFSSLWWKHFKSSV